MKLLACAARRGKGSKGGGGRVKLPDIDTRRLLELKYKLICHFKLAADNIRQFVNDADRLAFLERELIGLGVDGE